LLLIVLVSASKIPKTISKIFLAGTILVVLAALAGAALQRWHAYRSARRFPPPGNLVSVGSYSLHLLCRGSGEPTVFIAPGGYGGSTTYAARLIEILSARVRVCAYDPPGQGWSEEGPDAAATPERYRSFAALLAGADVNGQIVLVGESSGAHVVRLAADDPNLPVDGIVLVDPAFDDVERERAQWSAATRQRAARQRRLARAMPILAEFGLHRLLLRGPIAAAIAGLPPEHREMTRQQLLTRSAIRVLVDRNLERENGLLQVREARLPDDMPLVVLTARPQSVSSPYQREKEAYHGELAMLSTRGRHVVLDGAQHAMIGDRPDRVAEAIFTVIEQIRRPG
jgi:pimeloyl-ACP methyl ester carboxylesterase